MDEPRDSLAVKFIPHDYQTRMIEHVVRHPFCALWAEPGLGKTVVTLTAVQYLLDALEVRKVLVVAPKRVVQTVWPAEVEKWAHLDGLTVTPILGTAKRRGEAMREPTNIHAINYELLPWLVDQHSARSWPYDMVVFDESSKLKSRATQRFRVARKVRQKLVRVVELTGTPSPNGLIDLWSQLYLLDQGERLGKTLGMYRRKWFTENVYAHTYEPLPGAETEIHSRARDICVSLTAAEYLRLPDRVDNVISVGLPPSATEVYETLRRDLVLDLDDGEVSAANAAVLTGKLLQVANGTLYRGDGNHPWSDIHDAKIEALRNVVEEAGSPVLVFYSFRSDSARIRRAFPRARGVDDKGALEEWAAGRLPMLLAHPASAGHGLNLQSGGHVIAWFGLPWSLELYQQANGRLHRQGQTRPVIVHHLLAEGTLDFGVLQVLRGKSTVQEALLDACRAAA